MQNRKGGPPSPYLGWDGASGGRNVVTSALIRMMVRWEHGTRISRLSRRSTNIKQERLSQHAASVVDLSAVL